MKYRQNDNPFIFNYIENAVRKAADQATPDFLVNNWIL